MGWVQIKDIRSVDLLANAITELGIAMGLVMIHGPEHGAEVYVMLGGKVRFDEHDEPVIWADD